MVPRYDELPELADTGEKHAWGVFGADDERGTLNFLTPERVVSAAGLIRTGETIGLDLPLGEPKPQFWANRPPLEHVVRTHRHGRDDHLDGFNLQCSTQWDGLRHVRFRQFGYYGGLQDDELDRTERLGVGNWAERGIFGRGVLVDVAGYLERRGQARRPDETLEIDHRLIAAVLEDAGTDCAPGDILIVRTGWVEWYLALRADARARIEEAFQADRASFHAPGICPRTDSVAWLWDRQIAAVAIDTPTFEVLPYEPSRGWAHHRLLALLGMPLGELWKLDRLAAHCSAQQRYSFFLSSAPLNLPRGVGTPANAHAVF